MKKLFLVLFYLFSISLLSQEIDSSMYLKTWMEKETRIYNGYPVTKIFGQLPHMPRAYNVLPVTAVSYKSYSQLKDELEKDFSEQQFTETEQSSMLEDLHKKAIGGEIQIYLSRYEEDAANFKWFFIILRGEDDKGKIWEHEIGYQAPQNPYGRGWWNYTTVKIPVKITPPFFVYLNDKHSKYLSDFKFEVGLTQN